MPQVNSTYLCHSFDLLTFAATAVLLGVGSAACCLRHDVMLRWRDAGRQTSNLLSLDKAVLQDVQNDINVRDGAPYVWESFTPTAYLQVEFV